MGSLLEKAKATLERGREGLTGYEIDERNERTSSGNTQLPEEAAVPDAGHQIETLWGSIHQLERAAAANELYGALDAAAKQRAEVERLGPLLSEAMDRYIALEEAC